MVECGYLFLLVTVTYINKGMSPYDVQSGRKNKQTKFSEGITHYILRNQTAKQKTLPTQLSIQFLLLCRTEDSIWITFICGQAFLTYDG